MGARGPGPRAQVGLEILTVADDALAFQVEQRRTVADRQHRGIDEHLGGLRRGGRRGQRQDEEAARCGTPTGRPCAGKKAVTAPMPAVVRADRTAVG